MKIIPTEGLNIMSWCEKPDDDAINQAAHLAMLPFAFRHIALMPDTHLGYGMPIGGVLATKENIIIPNAVGVDIGCGMRAMATELEAKDFSKDRLKKIIEEIKKVVPLGFSRNSTPCPDHQMPQIPDYSPICEREYQNARKQIGTLGGGNHFIELQKDKKGLIWIMIHSGSRNIGKKVADYYNGLAEEKLKGTFSAVKEEWKLAFLNAKEEQGKRYLKEMEFCLSFANYNRKMMMDKIIDCLNVRRGAEIDVPHNYVALENHFGENVWVHRKGATQAYEDRLGIIPGSQGTCSYIVKGKGNPESFKSCSHGAGRTMGRKEAMRNLNIDEEIAKMDAKGIVHEINSIEQLDEAPAAYKDINIVMKEQADLVEIVTELTPIAVIKG